MSSTGGVERIKRPSELNIVGQLGHAGISQKDPRRLFVQVGHEKLVTFFECGIVTTEIVFGFMCANFLVTLQSFGSIEMNAVERVLFFLPIFVRYGTSFSGRRCP
jgi:hypothetical protein